jgi:hypothetical protein
MREEDFRSNTYKRGRQCLRSLSSDKNWTYWLGVIDALAEARTEAFEVAGTNEPVGSAYNRAFSGILEREKLQSNVIDSATRNHCLQIAANRASVEAWRATLPTNLRQTLNHPGAVFKRWKKSTMVPKPKDTTKLSPHAKKDETIREQAERIHQLEREREDGSTHVPGLDDPFLIIEALMAHTQGVDGERLAQELIDRDSTSPGTPRLGAFQVRDLASWLDSFGQHLARLQRASPKGKKRRKGGPKDISPSVGVKAAGQEG